ncbi:type VII secretion protein EssA [Weissella confusa]|uniref:type VII secretion protein EssA n=1 Tax=Weissella confusa TaxID=1583 RepID=UPI001C6F9430|nr:type VII secretion protein EssA [Weissella confusa]QYU58611.1 type VII secretion protein EssA [Weissella confusa]
MKIRLTKLPLALAVTLTMLGTSSVVFADVGLDNNGLDVETERLVDNKHDKTQETTDGAENLFNPTDEKALQAHDKQVNEKLTAQTHEFFVSGNVKTPTKVPTTKDLELSTIPTSDKTTTQKSDSSTSLQVLGAIAGAVTVLSGGAAYLIPKRDN